MYPYPRSWPRRARGTASEDQNKITEFVNKDTSGFVFFLSIKIFLLFFSQYSCIYSVFVITTLYRTWSEEIKKIAALEGIMSGQLTISASKKMLANFGPCWCFMAQQVFSRLYYQLLVHANLTKLIGSLYWTQNVIVFFNKTFFT